MPPIPPCGRIEPDNTVTVRLSWKPSPDAVSQEIEVWLEGLEVGIPIFVESLAPNTSEIELANLSPGTDYIWWIKSQFIDNTQVKSEVASFTTPDIPPPPPPPPEEEKERLPAILLIAGIGAVGFAIWNMQRRGVFGGMPESRMPERAAVS